MFNGIINFVGVLIAINKNCYHINTDLSLGTVIGASIACAGVCLTVIDIVDNIVIVEISHETLSCTNLKKWKIGSKMNLELSLQIGDRVDGHFVLGHVDTTVNITELTLLHDECYTFTLMTSENFMKYIAYKGSVALDGVSLTVNEVTKDTFSVNLLPYTFNNNTFQYNKAGDLLNMEVDILARYVNKSLNI